ncbi:hypothetical protein PCK1_000989 [Pneumocystis canis]|nr:hypothetical protein PCK1_000989 [Pneumocystis canis]
MIFNESPFHLLIYAYFYFIDTFISSTYSAIFAILWFMNILKNEIIPSDISETVNRFQKPEIFKSWSLDDSGYICNTLLVSFSTEKFFTILILCFFLCFKIYFCLVVFSYARYSILRAGDIHKYLHKEWIRKLISILTYGKYWEKTNNTSRKIKCSLELKMRDNGLGCGKFQGVDEISSNRSPVPVLLDFFQKRYKNDMNNLKTKRQIRQKILGSESVWLRKIKKKLGNNLLNNTKILKNQMVSKDSKLYDIWTENRNLPNLKPPSTLQHSRLFVSVDVPNVKVADPGASYNPLFEQHQKLIENEVIKEVSKVENTRERRLFNILKQEFTDNTDSEKLSKDIRSMEKTDNCVVNRKWSKKTRRQRKKELRKKKEANQCNEKILRKKQIKDLNSIDKIVELIEEKENTRKITNINNSKHDVIRKRSWEYSIRPLEIQLLDELTGSFRLLKPEGNIFIDRFTSLQERGFIEIRYPIVSYKKHRCRYVEN